jgi:hypothetical protein
LDRIRDFSIKYVSNIVRTLKSVETKLKFVVLAQDHKPSLTVSLSPDTRIVGSGGHPIKLKQLPPRATVSLSGNLNDRTSSIFDVDAIRLTGGRQTISHARRAPRRMKTAAPLGLFS